MKVLKSITITMLVASTLFITPGCNTLTPPTPIVQQLAPVIASTVSGAVIVAAQKNPSAIFYAATVEETIKSVTSTNPIPPSALQALLGQIPIKGIDPLISNLLLGAIVGVYESYAQQLAVNGVNNAGDLKVILTAMEQGIEQGISAATGTPKYLLPKGCTLAQQRAADVANYKKWRLARLSSK